MPNHWHLVLRPWTERALIDFMRWLSITHVRRHHGHYRGRSGHLYQGRYKSFPVQDDEYFLVLCWYVEANALRAGLVKRAELWRWSSLWQRLHDAEEPRLSDWPVDRPKDWLAIVNEAMEDDQVRQVHASIERDRPLGSQRWVERMAQRLGLGQSLRPRGRPRKPLDQLSPRQRQRRAATEGTMRQNGK
jgi:putative transposase